MAKLKNCLHCGEPLPADSQRNRKYCTDSCRAVASAKRKAARSTVAVAESMPADPQPHRSPTLQLESALVKSGERPQPHALNSNGGDGRRVLGNADVLLTDAPQPRRVDPQVVTRPPKPKRVAPVATPRASNRNPYSDQFSFMR